MTCQQCLYNLILTGYKLTCQRCIKIKSNELLENELI